MAYTSPYLLNLASPDSEIHGKSTRALADSLSRADILGARYVVTHIGSHQGTGLEDGLEQIRKAGFRWLMLLHMNDTRMALGSRRDRHANIGTGNIGERGFEALLNHPALVPLAGIIETPARTTEDDVRDIDILKRLRRD